MPINGVVFAAIEKLQGANNYWTWVSSLRTALQGESYEMWDLAIGTFNTEVELATVKMPTPEQALLGASEYFRCDNLTLAHVRQYIEDQVATPNRMAIAEGRRIQQLKRTATFYIRASVLPSAMWVIDNVYDPYRCFWLLSQQFSGIPWEQALAGHKI